MMNVHLGVVGELSELLGDDHDLAVLCRTLVDHPDPFGGELHVQEITDLINQRRAQLQARARPLGERLLAEKPKRIAARFHSYWK